MLIIAAILIGLVLIVVCTSILKCNTFLTIFLVSLFLGLVTLPLQEVVPTILLGFGLESDAIHSPNENYPLENFFKGIETMPYFYKYFAEMYKSGGNQ